MVADGRGNDVIGTQFKPPFLNIFSICSGGGKGIVATPLEIVRVYPRNWGFLGRLEVEIHHG
jgi:hypothetical protein